MGGGYYLYTYYQASDLKNQVETIKSELSGELPEDTWSFLVIGDTESNETTIETFINQANQGNSSLTIHLGDYVALGETEEFETVNALFDQLTQPIYPTLGNNDLGSVLDYSYDNYKKYIREELYYSFDYENAHFVILDNANRNIGFDLDQLAWLEEDLKNNQQQYTFVFFHKPFKLPLEEFTGDDETPRSRKRNNLFLEIIEKYPVQHIFAGHVHTYFTYTLQNTPTTISGGGGAPPQSILGGESASFYHYLEVTVNDEEFNVEINKL